MRTINFVLFFALFLSWQCTGNPENNRFIAEGHKNRKIAEYLCISVKTVEKHRSNLMKKLDLHNASELTAYAIENGLITQ